MATNPKTDLLYWQKLMQEARRNPKPVDLLAIFGPPKKSDPQDVARILEELEAVGSGDAAPTVAAGQASSSVHHPAKL